MGSKASKLTRRNNSSQCQAPPDYEFTTKSTSLYAQILDTPQHTKSPSETDQIDVLQPYTPPRGLDLERPIPNTGIKATDPPQWLWNNDQCREWAFAVLVDFYKKKHIEARRIANQFDSFGLGIYRFGEKGWRNWFGEEGGAMWDYMIVIYSQKTPTTFPPGFRYTHFEKKRSFA